MPALWCAALALLLALCAAPVLAHPLGNFTVNHFSRLDLAGDGVRVYYVLDMAEIPTFQELARMGLDADGRVPDAAAREYARTRAAELGRGLRLLVDGAPVPLALQDQALTLPPGQGNLPTLRLEAVYFAALPAAAGGPLQLDYRDDNDPTRIGWREIVARASGADTAIVQASVPATSASDELRSYPDDLLQSPLNVRAARVTFVPGAAAASASASASASGASPPFAQGAAAPRARDVYADLAAGELQPGVVALALLVAAGLGAVHALSPGHGKTVVAAYLVGARGTAKHALFLGATVTLTHTAGVYALGLVTLFLSQYVLPERLYPWLQLVSGLLVVAIGAGLLLQRWRAARPFLRDARGVWAPLRPLAARMAGAPALVPAPANAHVRAPAHHGGEPAGHAHGHGPPGTRVGYPHPHDHARGNHAHVHDVQAPGGHPHAHDDHAHGECVHGDYLHTHGNHAHGDHAHGDHHGHSHLPPGADGERVTWRSLLALGVSGGLLPCPSALVVLLSAIALHRLVFGLFLIVAFSLGLAAVLVGLGLLLVYARRLFVERVSVGGSVAARLLPVGSAVVILVAGLAIVVQALGQVG